MMMMMTTTMTMDVGCEKKRHIGIEKKEFNDSLLQIEKY